MQGGFSDNSHSFRNINILYRNEGIRGLFRGYYISAFCTPAFHTLYFPMYEAIKLQCQSTLGWHEGDFYLYSMSAAIAGITCNVITNPFWLVRTRM